MPSYVVVGASRGLGYAFLKVLASDPENIVVGLARDDVALKQRLGKDGLASSVHTFKTDVTNVAELKAARTEIEKVVQSIDYLIYNTAYKTIATLTRNLGEFSDDMDYLESEIDKSMKVNVMGAILTIDVLMPLVLRSSTKKIVALTSGMSSCEFTNDTGIDGGIPYSISKAGLNMLVAKYNATYKSDGVLVMGICAGYVNTLEGGMPSLSERDQARFQDFGAKVQAYATKYAGPVPPEEGASQLLKVMHNSSLVNGNGGTCVSFFGSTTKWL
ncbi:unnamed protein product [Clonostachys rosea]|uniref:Ketoreductase (KR) domain-containing protein n=1 Tax=Bionectria ochroleuca TaxID=29856 RepID=A0ABY6UWA6_BIOOC|nr:unnamed protein product [Clonostachys rosea]